MHTNSRQNWCYYPHFTDDKMKLRYITQYAKDHRVLQCQNQNSNLGESNSKSHAHWLFWNRNKMLVIKLQCVSSPTVSLTYTKQGVTNKNSRCVLQNAKQTNWLSNPSPRYIPKTTKNIYPHKNLYPNTHGYISTKVETNLMSINWYMNK